MCCLICQSTNRVTQVLHFLHSYKAKRSCWPKVALPVTACQPCTGHSSHLLQDGSYALGNHNHAPDASHPVYLETSNVVNVANDGLFKMTGPDPGWRNEADCGFQVCREYCWRHMFITDCSRACLSIKHSVALPAMISFQAKTVFLLKLLLLRLNTCLAL
jgi:hypothetical protein